MSIENDDSLAGFWLDPKILADQITELKQIQNLLEFLIKENIDDKKNWKDEGLLTSLFEYYNSTTQQLKIYSDVLLTKLKINKDTAKEEYVVKTSAAGLIISLRNLVRINKYNLTYNHGISLTIH